MDALKERGKLQRYVSILSRYPDYALEEDEDDEDTIERFKRRGTSLPPHLNR